MIRTFQLRDKKEIKLKTLEMQIELVEMNRERFKEDFKKHLALYQEWKKENNVEGLKY